MEQAHVLWKYVCLETGASKCFSIKLLVWKVFCNQNTEEKDNTFRESTHFLFAGNKSLNYNELFFTGLSIFLKDIQHCPKFTIILQQLQCRTVCTGLLAHDVPNIHVQLLLRFCTCYQFQLSYPFTGGNCKPMCI